MRSRTHPLEVLVTEFLKLDESVMKGKISRVDAYKLAMKFNTTPEFWLNLAKKYEEKDAK